MKHKQILLAILCALAVPLGLLALAGHFQEDPAPPPQTQPSQASEPRIQTEAAEPERTLRVLDGGGEVRQMEMEEYLVGVVLSEMPASFHTEALKAQAVVARTYALKREDGGKHAGGAVCMDAACCQGYIPPEAYLEDGGTRESVDRVEKAVEATRGMVLTYGGELIDATYFSCSGGMTEAAVEVWGRDVPYLQATDSPGEEDAAYYFNTVRFSAAEFAEKTGCSGSGDPADWFGPVSYTAGGGVQTAQICGKLYEGRELRRMLGLRSTAFTLEAQGEEILVETRGFGHRVGMSQYGAQAMAEEGCGYEEILAHYYKDTALAQEEALG